MTRPRTINQAPERPIEERANDAKIRGIENLKSRDARWYLPEFADNRAERIQRVAKHLWSENRARRENYARYWGLYSNLPLPGLTPRKYNQRLAGMARNKLSLNCVASVIDSFVALITDQRPRVSFQTSGGDWDLQQRAETLEKFNDGVIYENDGYELGAQIEKDVGIFGTGIVKSFGEGEGESQTIRDERVMPFWMFCDDEEAEGGDPRCFYQRRYIDRMRAMALWPKFADKIAEVQREAEDYEDAASESNSETDTVCITEAWHLPSGKGRWGHGGVDTGDGMHAMTCGNVLLNPDDLDFAGPYPFEFVYAQRPENGVWGRGLAEQLQGIQFEINTLLNMIRVAMRCGATLRWLVPVGTTLSAPRISDTIGGQIPVTGEMPQAITPPAVAGEVYQHLDRLWNRAFEVPGISQLSSQSQKPAGLNSGKALQTYADIESRRFQVAQHQYFNLFLRMARLHIHLARELGDNNPEFSVKSISRKTMSIVKWADAHMNERDFAMKEFATSAFANTPEARMQQIQDLLNAGSPLITPQEGRRLLNDPDIEEFDSLQDASYNLTRDIISDILAGRPSTPPLPLMDLKEAQKIGQLAWVRAFRMKAKKERLDALLQWIEQVKDATPPEAPPAPAPGQAPPGAAPGAPPGMGAAVQHDVQHAMAAQAAHGIMGRAA